MSHYDSNPYVHTQIPQAEGSASDSHGKRLSDPGPPVTENEDSEHTGHPGRRESEPGRGFSAFSLRGGMEEGEATGRRLSYAESSSPSQSFVSLADDEQDTRLAASQGPSAWRRGTLRPDDHQSYAEMSSATQSFVSFQTGLEETPTHSTAALGNYSDVESRLPVAGQRTATSRTGNSPYGFNNPFTEDTQDSRHPMRRQTDGYVRDEGHGAVVHDPRYGQPSRQQTAPSNLVGYNYGNTSLPPAMPEPIRQPTILEYGQTPLMPEPQHGQQGSHYGDYAFHTQSPSMPEPYDQSTIRQPTAMSPPSMPEAYGMPNPHHSSDDGLSGADSLALGAQIPNPWEATSNPPPMPSYTPHSQGRQPTISSTSTVSPRPVGGHSDFAAGQPQGASSPSQPLQGPTTTPSLSSRPSAPPSSAQRPAAAWEGSQGQSQVYNQPSPPQTFTTASRPTATPPPSSRPSAAIISSPSPSHHQTSLSANRPQQQQQSTPASVHPLQQQSTTPSFNRPQQQNPPSNVHSPQQSSLGTTKPPVVASNVNKPFRPEEHRPPVQQATPSTRPQPLPSVSNQSLSRPTQPQPKPSTNGHPATTYPPARPVVTEKPAKQVAQTAFTTPHQPVKATRGPGDTKYISMLLALDDIPPLWNILASFFTWILLAGFVLFPGTFTSLEQNEQLNAIGVTAVNVVKHVSLYVIAWVCTGIGAGGMLWLWLRWRNNWIWLVNRVFLPGFLNSLAGLLSTLSSALGSQDRTFSVASKSTVIVTSAVTGICGLLAAFYLLVPIRMMKNQHDRQVGKQHAGKHGAGYSGTRPRLPGRHGSQMDTKYVNMLLALDSIPMIYNLLTNFFTWILLAGFVLFPGTFTSLQNNPQLGAVGITAVNVIKHVSLFVIAWVCTGLGVAGMLWLWFRWNANYVWLVNRIFLPGLLNSLAGVVSTLASVYGAQDGTFSIASVSTITVTSASAGVCGLLTAFYMFVLIRNLKKQHDRQVGKQRAGKHGEGYTDISKRV
ncbi:hypothetical protein MIND_00282400 [Mycena indigotica]|uniref:Uncharacterized protein n=1 Tax=Mycena indigotica TaxID=2126181 RepID=A0A8H6T5X4_9AGAR|nr:uncharacterized protein MIND_00282400 [Mycena indigotica]KAF7312680.1 hypothetical protein MIND_00282400 [Mycena indigotica]